MLRLIFVFNMFLFMCLMILSVPSKADDIKKLIEVKAEKHGIDPALAIAIAKVESNLNPNAIGQKGEVGLFQLRPEFHNIGTQKDNVRTAMKYLKYVKRRCEPRYKEAWFICFNTGPNRKHVIREPSNFAYYKKVMRAYGQR